MIRKENINPLSLSQEESPQIRLVLSKATPYKFGELVEGKIILIPHEDIQIQQLGYRIVIIVSSNGTSYDYVISQKTYARDQKFLAHKEYIFPIRFYNNKYETYQGISFSYFFRMNVFAIHATSENEQSFLSRMNPFKKDKVWNIKKTLVFEAKKNQYHISSKDIPLKLDTAYILRPFGITLNIFILLFFLATNVVDSFSLEYFLMIFLIFILPYLVYFFIAYFLVGKINVEFKNIERGIFKASIRNNRNWKGVNNISSNYKVIEETRRDDNDQTLMYEVSHKSALQAYQNPITTLEPIFKFPKDELQTVNLQGARVFWLFEVKIKSFLGIRLTFKNEFTTRKR